MDKDVFEIKLDQYKPLREIVFETIRNAIISGDLKPGERLMEVQVAERLGVSRTPVREAIRKLELEGLVIMLPRKGAFVADLSVKDLTEVMEIRAALEGLAAGLASIRIDDAEIEELEVAAHEFHKAIEENVEELIQRDVEFHEAMFRASRNERLIQLNSNLREQVQRFRELYHKKVNKSKETAREHYEIVEAISERDVKKAERLARNHIENAEKSILKMMESENA
ncbi:MAG: transcriptional regulator, GntR family [Clostridia bacterium]|jgi:DNA-binding GntR family transcriptional regulator|nr:transcriptional regulator, GntR family [Clostridia bacterium]